ncbi:MAG: hypothetical protein ACC628_08220 [Pirellulaceae bacterium]
MKDDEGSRKAIRAGMKVTDGDDIWLPVSRTISKGRTLHLTFRTSGSCVFPFSTRDFRSLSSVNLRPTVQGYVGSFVSAFRSLMETIDLNAAIYETALM